MTPEHPARGTASADIRAALSILLLLIGAYSLTYSGHFIADDEHILLSRGLSLAFDGSPNDLRVYGNSRVFALANAGGVYAAQGTNIEPGQAALSSVLAWLAQAGGAGRVQTMFVLNIWAAALTAALLFIACRQLGRSLLTSVTIAGLFGLATAAWPFTRTFFRDPLAMLFLMIAWIGAQQVSTTQSSGGHRLGFALLGAGLLGGALMKNTVAIAAPALLLYVASRKLQHQAEQPSPAAIAASRRSRRAALYWAAGGIMLFSIWLVIPMPDGFLARLSFEYYRIVLQGFFTKPHDHFLAAIAGPLISPGKSIFLFSPVLVLAFAGRGQWRTAWPAWLYVGLLIVAQALFYDADWHGHISWGLRFMLPALPPLMLAAAPVVEHALASRRGRWGLIALGAISVLVQIIAVLAPVKQYYVDARDAGSPALIWNADWSALLWHARWLLNGGQIDLAITRLHAWSILLCSVLIIGLTLMWWRAPRRWWMAAAALVVGILQPVWLPLSVRHDPVYGAARGDLDAAYAGIAAGFSPGDLVVVKSYGTPAWDFWMNWAEPDIRWASLPYIFPAPALIEQYQSSNDPAAALDEISLSLLQRAADTHDRVWMVSPADSPGADLGLEAAWLEGRAETKRSWVFTQDGFETRLYLFEFPSGNEH